MVSIFDIEKRCPQVLIKRVTYVRDCRSATLHVTTTEWQQTQLYKCMCGNFNGKRLYNYIIPSAFADCLNVVKSVLNCVTFLTISHRMMFCSEPGQWILVFNVVTLLVVMFGFLCYIGRGDCLQKCDKSIQCVQLQTSQILMLSIFSAVRRCRFY